MVWPILISDELKTVDINLELNCRKCKNVALTSSITSNNRPFYSCVLSDLVFIQTSLLFKCRSFSSYAN